MAADSMFWAPTATQNETEVHETEWSTDSAPSGAAGSATVCQLDPFHCWTFGVLVSASVSVALTQKTDETHETAQS